MLFNSLHYIIFFPIVVIVYYLLPQRTRWILLLVASYYFYACIKIEYLGILLFSTLIDYISGLRMSKLETRSEKRKWLLLSILTNISLLCFFKYFNFFSDSARLIFNHFNIFSGLPHLDLLWPVGISFYTFQALSYTIDVYRNDAKPEKHFGYFALYVSFFPQLLAGPIERSSALIPQHKGFHRFDMERINDGLKLIIMGFFKKIVIADNIAVYVGQIYQSPGDYYGFSIISAVFLFAFQVYCDFSGYTDIALGSAKILGYDLTNNFKRPFFSKSMTEFWSRWHITLSGWFRDYVFIPLYSFFNKTFKKIELKKRHNLIYSLSIFVTLVLLGLWHGSHFKFILMGAFFGLIIILEQLSKKLRQKFYKTTGLEKHHFILSLLQVAVTFSLFSFTTIFLRARTLSDSVTIMRNFFKFSGTNFFSDFYSVFNETWRFLLLIIFLIIVDLVERKRPLSEFLKDKPKYFVWWIYIMLVLFILSNLNFANIPFIYFYF